MCETGQLPLSLSSAASSCLYIFTHSIPALAVSNVCGQGCVNLHFQEMAVPFYVRHRSIYFGGGRGAPGFLTPVVSYTPRPISR